MLEYLLKLLISVILATLVCFNIPETFVGGSNSDFNSIKTQDIIAGDIFFEIIDPSELEYTYRVRPAKDFGAPFNSSFKANNVALVPTDPFDACTEKFINADDIYGNVALVERGECTFVSKAINVEKAGARAIIITELDSSTEFDYYIEMIHDNSDRDANIPAGYLIGKSGRIITQTLKKLRKRYARINLPVNLTFTPPHKMNHPPWMGCFVLTQLTIININPDFIATNKLNKRFWKNTGMCPPQPLNETAAWYLSNDMTLNLKFISSLSHSKDIYIRAHWLFELIQQNKTEWFDKFINNLYSFNLNPTIEFMGTNLNYNIIFNLFTKYIDFYGVAWLKKWRFETWNEPDLLNFNVKHFDYELYLDYIVKTKNFIDQLGKYMNSGIKLYGPAGLFKNELKHPFCWGILDECNRNLQKCPFDQITFHRKGNESGASTEILAGTQDLVKLIMEKFPNLIKLPYANDESDPLTGWSRPNEFHADVRYASIFVSSILLHLHAKNDKSLQNLSFLSNDNGFLSYYPFQFEQRTLLARFQMNNTNPPHVQYFVKPIYSSMHLLNNLDKISERIIILDNNYTYIVTKNRKHKATFYSVILTPIHINQYSIDRCVIIKLNVTNFVGSDNYIFIELLENNNTDPFNFWKLNYHRIPYPNYKQRHLMRRLQYPSVLQNLTSITNNNVTTNFKYNITSPFIMSIRIVNSPSRITAPTHLSYIKIYKNFELLLTWRQNKSKFIKTYQIYFRKTFNWVCITCKQHIPFLHYQYQRYGVKKNILGYFKIRSVDLFGRKSKFSQIIKVY